MSGYLTALAVTLVVETPLYALALRRYLGAGARAACLGGLLVNLSSHPLAWFAVWRATGSLVAVEVFAVGWETAALYAWLRRDAALLGAVALVVNGVSLAAGAAVVALG